MDVVESRSVSQDGEAEAGGHKVVKDFEGEDYSEKFEVVGTVALMSRGEGARATANKVPIVKLHKTKPHANF